MHLLSVFSLRNRALIALITIVIGVFGGIALTTLKQELFPSITLPQLAIVTSTRVHPRRRRADVSTPIETAICGRRGLDSTTATSNSGLSRRLRVVHLRHGHHLGRAEDPARDRPIGTLPGSVDPQVITGRSSDFPVAGLAVTSDLDPHELLDALDASTLNDLQQLDGVSQATLSARPAQRITITPDTDALAAGGLSKQSIRDALDANGILLAGGTITENDKTLIVQSGTALTSAEDIAAIPLLGGSADPVTAAPSRSAAVPPSATSPASRSPTTRSAASRASTASRRSRSPSPRAGGQHGRRLEGGPRGCPALAEALGGNTKFTVVFDQAPFIEQSIDASPPKACSVCCSRSSSSSCSCSRCARRS